MKRKAIFSTIIFIVISVLGTLCFANTNDTKSNGANTVNLKNEITQSLDKTRNTTENVTNDGFSGGARMMNEAGNDIMNMTGMNNNNNNNNANQNNGGYNTTRTSVDNAYFTGNNMDTTTWLWMILAIVAIIIVTAVWYYAMQGADNRNNKD